MVALLLLLAVPVPRAALLDQPVDVQVVARAQPRSEPLRGVAEYFASLAAFTLVNAGGSALLSGARVNVSQSRQVSLGNSGPSLAAGGVCFALSPLALAVTSYFIGKGSDSWDPSLGWTTLGAYGSSLIAVGAGLGLAAADLDRGAAIAADTALYLAVPLGTVLLQNATKSQRSW